jgi:hypothetical protein
MTVAGFIPITALPILKTFFFKIVTEEIPKEFLFPKTVKLDFTPETVSTERTEILKESAKQMDQLTDEQLAERHPEQWSLFDAIDLDGSGCLSGVELYAGLQDWGYTAEDASQSFAKMDLDSDNKITFREFVRMWPKLAESFVPSQYKGALTVSLKRGENIPEPRVGESDPYVRLRLGNQAVQSKRDSESSVDGARGAPVWVESFDINVMDPKNDTLEVAIMEGSRWQFPPRKGQVIAKANVELGSFLKRPTQKLKIQLEPQGYMRLDLSYAEFVNSAPEATQVISAAEAAAKAIVDVGKPNAGQESENTKPEAAAKQAIARVPS